MPEAKVTRPTAVPSEDKGTKRLSICIGVKGEKMAYEFSGHWTGKDVELIQRTIRRAYLSYTRDIRRANTPITPILQESPL